MSDLRETRHLTYTHPLHVRVRMDVRTQGQLGTGPLTDLISKLKLKAQERNFRQISPLKYGYTLYVGYKVKKVLYSHIIYMINILTMAIWLIYNVTIKDLENSNYYFLSPRIVK